MLLAGGSVKRSAVRGIPRLFSSLMAEDGLITEWGISDTTLEEVFLRLAAQNHEVNASIEGGGDDVGGDGVERGGDATEQLRLQALVRQRAQLAVHLELGDGRALELVVAPQARQLLVSQRRALRRVEQVGDARAAAAAVGVGQGHQLQARHRRQQAPGRAAHALDVGQVAGVVVGHARLELHGRAESARRPIGAASSDVSRPLAQPHSCGVAEGRSLKIQLQKQQEKHWKQLWEDTSELVKKDN